MKRRDWERRWGARAGAERADARHDRSNAHAIAFPHLSIVIMSFQFAALKNGCDEIDEIDELQLKAIRKIHAHQRQGIRASSKQILESVKNTECTGSRKNMSNQRPERPAQHSTRMETRCEGAKKKLLPRTTRHHRREPCAALDTNGNEVRGSKKGSYLARRAIKEERPGYTAYDYIS